MCITILNGIGAIFIMRSDQIIRKQTADACNSTLPPYSPSLENNFLQFLALSTVNRTTIIAL